MIESIALVLALTSGIADVNYDMNDEQNCESNYNPRTRSAFPNTFAGFRFGTSIEEVKAYCNQNSSIGLFAAWDTEYPHTTRYLCDLVKDGFDYNRQFTMFDFCDQKLCGISVVANRTYDPDWNYKFVEDFGYINRTYGIHSCETNNSYYYDWKTWRDQVGPRIIVIKDYQLVFSFQSAELMKRIRSE